MSDHRPIADIYDELFKHPDARAVVIVHEVPASGASTLLDCLHFVSEDAGRTDIASYPARLKMAFMLPVAEVDRLVADMAIADAQEREMEAARQTERDDMRETQLDMVISLLQRMVNNA